MTVPAWLRPLVAAALVAAVFAFLGLEIYRNAEQLRDFRWSVRPWLLLLSVGALMAALLSGVWVWRRVIYRFGLEVRFHALARAWFLANLSRYIPGVVWQFVSLAQLGPSAGLSPAAMITTVLSFFVLSLMTASILGAWLLPAGHAGDFAVVVLVIRWLSPLALAAVHPGLVRSALGLVARLTGRTLLSWQGSWLDGVRLLVLSALSWTVYGLAFHLFLASFVPLPLSTLPSVIAANALAFVIGYLVVFAPGGLGVKEGALALLLASFLPPAVAASLAIASRLWTIAAEVVAALLLLRRPAFRP